MSFQLFFVIFGFVCLELIQLVWLVTSPKRFSISETIRQIKGSSKTGIIQFGLFILNAVAGLYFPWPASRFDPVFLVGGVVIMLAGTLLAIWAKLVMKNNWNIPAVWDESRQKELVIKGPFKFSRNPIYLGLILLVFGYSVAVRSLFLPLLGLFYWYVVSLSKKRKLCS